MPDELAYDTKPIEEALVELEYSNEKAAVYAGLSSTTMTKIRKADDGVKVKTLRKLARALNLQVEIRFTPKPRQTETAGSR